MSLRLQINEDIKSAMRAGDKNRLGTLRLISAALKQKEVDERITLEDAGVLAVLEKMLKQRRDSIAQFEAAGRLDLAGIEQAEVAVITSYLPAALDPAEIEAAIQTAIIEAGAGTGPQAMGKVMGLLKPRLAGRADLGLVSQRLKALLVG